MTQLTELDYESIENAVMETARGRWFLAEHRKRQSEANTGSTPVLLDAISRLEKVITSIGSDFSPQMEPTAPEAAPATGCSYRISNSNSCRTNDGQQSSQRGKYAVFLQ